MAKYEVKVALKRAYEQPEQSDGTRVLVDRLWPRGLSKERAQIDVWLKEIAPSHELRQWYGHEPEKFGEFRRRYESELASETGKELLARLHDLTWQGQVTLVFSSRDVEHSNAAVLRDMLLEQ